LKSVRQEIREGQEEDGGAPLAHNYLCSNHVVLSYLKIREGY
jgi:hypothetical protein